MGAACLSCPGGPAGGSERRSMPVADARAILEDVEADEVLPQELLAKEAVSVQHRSKQAWAWMYSNHYLGPMPLGCEISAAVEGLGERPDWARLSQIA